MDDSDLNHLDPAEARKAALARIAPRGNTEDIARLQESDLIAMGDLGVPRVQYAPVADIADMPSGEGSEALDESLDIHEIHELEDPAPVEPIDTENEDPDIQDFLDNLDEDEDEKWSPPH